MIYFILQGMCFCQYVLHREQEETPISVMEQMKDHVVSMKKNALKKSHQRRSRSSLLYTGPVHNKDGKAHFANDTPVAYI